MNSDKETIFDIFVEDCDCENCEEKLSKPDLFANIITVNGKSSIQVFNSNFKHLEEEKYASVFDALAVIKENNLTLLAWV
jgi:hypothetical protein